MPITKKKSKDIVDSRYLKILSTKKEDLENAIVLICFDENKFDKADKEQMTTLVEKINELVPSGVYLPLFRKCKIELYHKDDFKNKNVLITIKHDNSTPVDRGAIEKEIAKGLPEAKSLSFIHQDVDISIVE